MRSFITNFDVYILRTIFFVKPMNHFLRLIALTFFILSISISCKKQPSSDSLFVQVDSNASNIHFANTIMEGPSTNAFFYEYIYNGGGVGIGDVNNDGLEDLYFTSNFGSNKLYLNKGEFEFTDITNASNTADSQGWSTGISMVDINNDGLLDIYVCKSGPLPPQQRKNMLLVNQGLDKSGTPTFKDEAEKYGIASDNFSIQATFFDFDNDGDLDMYLMNHNGNKLSKEVLAMGSKEPSPLGDQFYIREGDRYIEKTEEVGIYSNAISYGLGIGVSDLNNDGWPDLYISNDYEEYDYMYINQQNGTFKEVIKTATNHISNFSMGNDIADFDNDGFTDVIALDMVAEDNYGIKTSMPSMSVEKFNSSVAAGRHYQYMYNTLQRNTTFVDKNNIPHFSEIGQIAGISSTDWSWGPLLADFDNDGLKDLFITNGIKRDFRNKDYIHSIKDYLKKNRDAFVNPKKIMELVNKTPTRPKTNYVYKNNGNLGFENITANWFGKLSPGYSNGAAYADLDNDGDLDLVINNIDNEAGIFENTSTSESNYYLQIGFKGTAHNKQGIGTHIKVYTNKGIQVFENYTTRGYQSCKPASIHIGLGTASLDSLLITWPNGNQELLQNIKPNQQLTVDYQNSTPPLQTSKNQHVLFTTTSNCDSIEHQENKYDDYRNQVLLPHKLSQFGPALAIADINNDGIEDLYVGNASGYTSELYLGTKSGKFISHQSFTNDKLYEDIDAQFFDYDQDGDLDLYVVSGGNEWAEGSENYKDRLYENVNGNFKSRPDLLPNIAISGSVVKVADYDKDGFSDLFIGGRHTPHNYPTPTSSYILRNNKGVFEDVTSTIAPSLFDVGMVTDASWTDTDGDEDLDLMIVGEWMSPILFENNNGQFAQSNSMPEFLDGWYYAIEPLDIDNDGDLDFVVGNLGSNYKYKASEKEPFELYYADFDSNGSKDIVLGYYNFGELFPLRGKDCSTQQVPKLETQIETYDLFGSSTLTEVYSAEALASALVLRSHNFKSGILINDGNNHFHFRAFPQLAQVSSINDFIVKDLNNDGYQDVILAGNLFVSEIETPRNDAGYGLVLINNKNGGFNALDAHQTGFFVSSDVKKLRTSNKRIFIGSNNASIKCYNLN